MYETPLKTSQSLTSEHKCAALEAVLHSQTFARADQLKCFLKYVCEMEMSGRGQELTEYLIGIEALGRPANYSPGDDSGVRTQAFALRKKLQEFYEHEQPQSTLRIELSKGSYCPHFIERFSDTSNKQPQAEPEVSQNSSLIQELTPLPTIERVQGNKNWLLPFGAGALVMALFAIGLYWWKDIRMGTNTGSRNVPPILAEAWGPLLTPNADVLLCVANPPAFSVLPGPFSPPPPQTPLAGERHLPRDLYELFAARYPPTTNLSLTITPNATYWGDVLGALTTFKTLNTAGVAPQMFPEMVTSMPTLRHRNVILFGASAYSATVTRFLENCPLQVKYLDAVVGAGTAQGSAEHYGLKRDQKQRLIEVFGLITVLPGESSGNHQNRNLIFSGVNSAGTQAAAEFFSSPEHLLEFKKALKKSGHESFPPAYQIVVRAKTDDSILLNFQYETCRIFQPSANH